MNQKIKYNKIKVDKFTNKLKITNSNNFLTQCLIL